MAQSATFTFLTGSVVDSSGLHNAGANFVLAEAIAPKPVQMAAAAFAIPRASAGNRRRMVSSPGLETKEVAVKVGSKPLVLMRVVLKVNAVRSGWPVRATRSSQATDT